MPVTYEPIATATLGTAANSYTFSSIPSTYTDLVLTVFVIEAVANNYGIRINGDSAANYSDTYMYGGGDSSVNRSNDTSTTQAFPTQVGGSATFPTFMRIHFFSYTNSGYKTFLMEAAQDRNASGSVDRSVGLYRSTSAITSIEIRNASVNNLSVGSIFTLYGIKAA